MVPRLSVGFANLKRQGDLWGLTHESSGDKVPKSSGDTLLISPLRGENIIALFGEVNEIRPSFTIEIHRALSYSV